MKLTTNNDKKSQTCFCDLSEKKVLVTGAASGIGYATAIRFLDEGCHLIAVDKNKEELEKKFNNKNFRVSIKQVDITSYHEMLTLFDAIDSIDIVIANAGISIRKNISSTTQHEWNSIIDTNLTGTFNTIQLAIRKMEYQAVGNIIAIASTNGLKGYPNYSAYNASKAGVIALVKTTALEIPSNIRINAICPGYVMTPMQEKEYTSSMLKFINNKIPLNRHANPSEIAAVIAFLSSTQSSYIHGQTIVVDGGEIA